MSSLIFLNLSAQVTKQYLFVWLMMYRIKIFFALNIFSLRLQAVWRGQPPMVKRLRSQMDTLLRYFWPFDGFRLRKSDLRSEERIFDIFYSFYSAFESVFNILLIVNLLVWPGPRIFQIFYSLLLSRSRRTAPRTKTLLPPWRSGEKSATDSISRARKCKFSFFPFLKTKTGKETHSSKLWMQEEHKKEYYLISSE